MIIKTSVSKNNPDVDIFMIEDFKRFIPALKVYMGTADGIAMFEAFMPMAYEHCFRSLWGAQWHYGMSLLTAHYITMASKDQGGEMGAAETLGQVGAIGEPTGVLTGQSVGEISINYDISKTMFDITDDPDAAFFNETKFGIRYYSLWKTKNPFIIGVVI